MTVIWFLLKFMSDNDFIKGAEKTITQRLRTDLFNSFCFPSDCLPHHDHHRVPPEVHVRQPIHKNRKLRLHNGWGPTYLVHSFLQIVSLTMTIIGFLLKFMSDNDFIKGAEKTITQRLRTDLLDSFFFPQILSLTMTIIGFLLKFMSAIEFIKNAENTITQRLRTDLFYSFFFLQIVSLTMTLIGFLLKFMSDNKFIKGAENTITQRLWADLFNSFFPQIVSLTMTIIGFLLKFMSDNQFTKGAWILLHNGWRPTYFIHSFFYRLSPSLWPS